MNFVFDANIWLEIVTQHNSTLHRFFYLDHTVYLSSYMIIEILRALKRITKRIRLSYQELEEYFWSFLEHPVIHCLFDYPVSNSLINEIKNLPEIRLISKTFDLELKDVPYIITAFEKEAELVTEDIRSLIDQRATLTKKIGVFLLTKEEFIGKYLK